jgi:hypothetical protein
MTTLDKIRAIVAKFQADIAGMETVDETGWIADAAMSAIDDALIEAGDES